MIESETRFVTLHDDALGNEELQMNLKLVLRYCLLQ